MRQFGMSLEDYEKLFNEQNGRCAICGTTKLTGDSRALSVDHNHTTGKIRGLLCSRCNRGLGYFKDNVMSLLSAIRYLMKANNQEQVAVK
jgi:hypothetical protein